MLSTLIVCKEFSTAKRITNKIVSNVNDLQIIGIANTLNETKELILNNEPEIIITTNVDVVNLLEKDTTYYGPKIIFISRLKKFETTYKHVLFLSFDLSFKDMSKKIIQYIKKDVVSSKKEKASNILSKLGFEFKLSGTVYLLDSILYVNTHKGEFSYENLSRDLYSHIAEINNTTSDRVKWSISRSFNYTYDRHTKETYGFVEKYLGLTYPEKFTPKLVIGFIANNLNS